jgi:hypothetical protein
MRVDGAGLHRERVRVICWAWPICARATRDNEVAGGTGEEDDENLIVVIRLAE